MRSLMKWKTARVKYPLRRLELHSVLMSSRWDKIFAALSIHGFLFIIVKIISLAWWPISQVRWTIWWRYQRLERFQICSFLRAANFHSSTQVGHGKIPHCWGRIPMHLPFLYFLFIATRFSFSRATHYCNCLSEDIFGQHRELHLLK